MNIDAIKLDKHSVTLNKGKEIYRNQRETASFTVWEVLKNNQVLKLCFCNPQVKTITIQDVVIKYIHSI